MPGQPLGDAGSAGVDHTLVHVHLIQNVPQLPAELLVDDIFHGVLRVSIQEGFQVGDAAGTSLFAITMPEEFHRVLTQDGLFFQVLAAQDHLLGLKSIIYPQLLLKEKDSVPDVPGFELLESRPIRFTFTVEGKQVQNLLSMTPHVYRISKEGAARLEATQSLTDTASCVLNIYRKR